MGFSGQKVKQRKTGMACGSMWLYGPIVAAGKEVNHLNRDELRGKIEAVRAELNALAKQVGIQAQAVLVKSQELDELLNQYNRNLKKGEV